MVSTRASTRGSSIEPDSPVTSSPTKSVAKRGVRKSTSTSAAAAAATGWSHTPSTPTLFWLALSLPLVIWDTGYVLGRPHTMPGGSWHTPLYSPYKLYGEIDGVYGFNALNNNDGFPSAQAFLNVIETFMYIIYLWAYFKNGRVVKGGQVGAKRSIGGRAGALAVLIGFSAAVMTLSKTILYGAHEHFAGYKYVGHNNPIDLIVLYAIPNGAWIVGSSYMVWSFGSEIIQVLTDASNGKAKAS